MDLQKHLGARVRRARRAANLTQEQLAERLDKSVRTISNIESGNVLVGIDTLSEISILLKTSMLYFFEETDLAPRNSAPRRELWEGLVLKLQGATDRELSIVSVLVDGLIKHREDENSELHTDPAKDTSR